MGPFIARRLVLSVAVLFLVTILTFFLIHLIPGDPVRTMLGQDATQEQVDLLRKELWLDRPLYVQYWHWISNAFTGDLGDSLYHSIRSRYGYPAGQWQHGRGVRSGH